MITSRKYVIIWISNCFTCIPMLGEKRGKEESETEKEKEADTENVDVVSSCLVVCWPEHQFADGRVR